MLINKKKVKEYALDCSQMRHHKFSRVSKEFLIYVDDIVKTKVRDYVNSLPSVGKTIK